MHFTIPTLQDQTSHPQILTKPGKPMVPKLALNSIPSRNNENSMSSLSSPRRQSRAFSLGCFYWGGCAVLKTVENGICVWRLWMFMVYRFGACRNFLFTLQFFWGKKQSIYSIYSFLWRLRVGNPKNPHYSHGFFLWFCAGANRFRGRIWARI